jgi:alcohol dehydrogenase
MKATVYHGAHDVRLENVPDPSILAPTDAIVRVTRAAICGSDLWFYRGITTPPSGSRTGHEFVGIVDAVGSDVRTVKPGDHVIAPFMYSDGTCEFCDAGLQSSCLHGSFFGGEHDGGQAQAARVPFADGTLVKMAEGMSDDPRRLASALTLCDVMGTGHHGVVTSQAQAGGTVVVIGDGAVGLCAVLSAARVVRAERVIAIGHNDQRLALAREFGATHTFNSHHDGVAGEVLELTGGGSHSVVEAVGNQASMELGIELARPGGTMSFVGVPANVGALPLRPLFLKNVSLHGALAPTRAYLETLMSYVVNDAIDPGRVFDLALPLERVGEGYAAMDERKAVKVILDATV